MTRLLVILLLGFGLSISAQDLKIAKLKYGGGGDWYVNKTALPNLINFTNRYLKTEINKNEDVVEAGSPDLFLYPYVYMTGHGNVMFTDSEAENLRTYLLSGGFLHIDDNYGLDPFIRVEIKRIFPDKEFVEIPFDHPIYHQRFEFNTGLPKIHEHDGKPPQGLGILHEGRLICFYSYETDLGNGWEDQNVHNDPEPVRQKALQMGANILSFVFSGTQ
jgi:hypothetical protein